MGLYRVVVLALALAFVSLVFAQETKVITQDLIDTVNNHPASTWRAGHNQFSSYTAAQIKSLLGTKLELKSPGFDVMPPNHIANQIAATIPDNFDSRVTFSGCVHPIRNQAQCGSCWAFGATEALSDRFCIASNGTINVVLAPQDLVSCDDLNFGCNGGQLFLAWMYMKHSGVVSETCFPYQSQTGNAPSCPSTCANGQPFTQNKYYASQYYKVSPSIIFWERVVDIQKEIMANGPVEAAFSVYQDFMAYTSGVYQHLTGSFLGGHAIKIIGWGVESGSGTPYWLVANSWGPTWGEKGFFKILRGKDECGIEAEAYAGTPDVANAPKN